MRQRLIGAAVVCLYELGYAATTTQVVTDRAGVSRGAILHHFPTKVDLMVAVAQYAADYQDRQVAANLASVEAGAPLYLAITRACWEVMVQPPGMALLEVMMATRSDPELAQRLPPVIDDFEAKQRAAVWRRAQEVGVTDQATVEAMVRLHRAAMRGLAIELSLTRDRDGAEASLRLLERYKATLTNELVTHSR